MGLRDKCINYVHEMLSVIEHGSDMCLLGNLYIHGKVTYKGTGGPAYRYFERFGFDVISIDINKLDTALEIDLCYPIKDVELLSKFDVVIDAGTGEHIQDQYELFKNIFSLLKVGGIGISILPYELSYPRHGYWTYSESFLRNLVKFCNCKTIDYRISNNRYFDLKKHKGTNHEMLYFTLQKTDKTLFGDKTKFKLPLQDKLGAKRNNDWYIQYKESKNESQNNDKKLDTRQKHKGNL